MGYQATLVITLILVLITVAFLVIYFTLMLKGRRRLEDETFLKCPKFIIRRYRTWHYCWVIWSALWYILTILPLFASMITIYFSASEPDTIYGKDGTSLLSIFAFISAFLPLVSTKIQPKLHADGFYKGLCTLEEAMLKFTHSQINEQELIDILYRVEPYTNPRSTQNNTDED